MWQSRDDAEMSLGATPGTGWKTYTNTDGGITFQYPSDWTSRVTEEAPYADGTFSGVYGVVTSLTGGQLGWIYRVAGGKDSPSCAPGANDSPFAPGNRCASKQIISVEQIASIKSSAGKKSSNLFKDKMYITKTKFDSGAPGYYSGPSPNGSQYPSHKTTYQICLDPYSNEDQALPKVGTEMGFELPCRYLSTGFNAVYPVNSLADFDSPDAKTAVLIMKSFNSVN